VKSQKALKIVLAILTFSKVIGPGASAKAILWKTSGQKGGLGEVERRKSRFCRNTYVQPSAKCGMNGNGNGKANRKGRQERKGRQRLIL
jgi:hypothetical protein